MPVVSCNTTPAPIHGVVTFDPAVFKVAYPEFAGISDAILNQNFSIATLLLDNTCGSRVSDGTQREVLLSILVAHITYMTNGTNDGAGNINPAPGMVGRVNQAGQGSVNVSAEFSAVPSATMAYFVQSKYGVLYWTVTANFRTLTYIPAPADCSVHGPGFPLSF